MDSVTVYDRQRKLGLSVPKAASVVGCGGVGAWVGIDLALSGVEKLCLFDDDMLEYHNLNRLPFTADDVGKPKVDILKDFIQERRPHIAIRTFGKVSEMTKSMLEGAVVDCTDKLAAQKLIYDGCQSKKLRYYRVGYDGNHITIFDAKHPKSPKPKKVWDDGSGRDGYTIVSSWAAPPQMIASMITYMICYPNRQFPPLSGDIGEIMNGASKYLSEGQTLG